MGHVTQQIQALAASACALRLVRPASLAWVVQKLGYEVAAAGGDGGGGEVVMRQEDLEAQFARKRAVRVAFDLLGEVLTLPPLTTTAIITINV